MKFSWSKDVFIVWIGVAVVSLLFLLTAFALTQKGWGYISPDETANRFFIESFAKEGSFKVLEPLNLKLGDILFPRSIISAQGFLLPVSFLGLPILYGTIASLTGGSLASALTILFSFLAMIAWYGVVKKIISKEVAVIAFFLLALLPAWGYYTARLLMPNVPFISFLIFSLWFALQRQWKKVGWHIVLSGLLFGVALSVRLSEIIWLAPVVFGVMFFNRSKLTWKTVFIFLGGVCVPLIVVGFIQWKTYGSFFTTGYTFHVPAISDTVITDVTETSSVSWSERINSFITPIFPFGIHPRAIVKSVFSYFFLFWWFTVPSLFSFVWFVWSALKERKTEQGRRFLIICGATVFSGLWLLLAYGSWSFNDNPDPTQVTIANSYVRYWLPIFVAGTIPFAWGIKNVLDCINSIFWKKFITIGGFVILSGLFVWSVWFSAADGLLKMRSVLSESQQIRQSVLLQVDQKAVIVVDRADKIFFPFRRVIYPLRSEETYESIPRILEHVPVYYFGVTFPQKDTEYLNNIKLPPLGIQIEFVESFGFESLYRFAPQK